MSTTHLEYLSLCVQQALTRKHWVLSHGYSWALEGLLKRKTEISALAAVEFNCWVVFPSTLSRDCHGTSVHHWNPGWWKSFLKGPEEDRMIFFSMSSWAITGTGWGLAPVVRLRADCFLHAQQRFTQSVPRKIRECASQAVQTYDVSFHSDFSWQYLSGDLTWQLSPKNLNPGKFSLKGRRLGLGEPQLLLAPVHQDRKQWWPMCSLWPLASFVPQLPTSWFSLFYKSGWKFPKASSFWFLGGREGWFPLLCGIFDILDSAHCPIGKIWSPLWKWI